MYRCLSLLLDCGFPQGKSLCFLGPCVLFPYDDDIAATQYVLVEASYEDKSDSQVQEQLWMRYICFHTKKRKKKNILIYNYFK